ncbi:hypothetical protein A6R68_20785, partial [Neotoma lepida]
MITTVQQYKETDGVGGGTAESTVILIIIIVIIIIIIVRTSPASPSPALFLSERFVIQGVCEIILAKETLGSSSSQAYSNAEPLEDGCDRGNTSFAGQGQSYRLVSDCGDKSWSHGEFEIINDHRVRTIVSLRGRLNKCDTPPDPECNSNISHTVNVEKDQVNSDRGQTQAERLQNIRSSFIPECCPQHRGSRDDRNSTLLLSPL